MTKPGEMTRIVGKKGADPNHVSLNLIYEYPVRWSKYKVLRDLLQNFYDAVGAEQWHERFSHRLDGDMLTMKASDTGFSCDWLVHMGASTKRDSDGKYAGFFGEGFKIASLCALRDHGWNIEMSSREWELKVVTGKVEIEDRHLTSLAYKVWKNDVKSRDTTLYLYPFRDDDVWKAALQSFFYPENPLFGGKIWSSPEAAVYRRSKVPKPVHYPSTYDYEGQGIIFAGFQALGSFQYPLVFCLHGYRLNDRERGTFYRMDVVKVIERTVRKLPPGPAAEVLEALKTRWYEYPRKKYDFDTWYHIIGTLVSRIARGPDQSESWRRKYPHLLVAEAVNRRDVARGNRRRQARAWLKNSGEKYRLVQEHFKELGYPTMEQMCEEHGGFATVRDPSAKEVPRIDILEKAVSVLLQEFLDKTSLPPCKIIESDLAAWSGMTECIRLQTPRVTFKGLKIRYRLPYVALKRHLLKKENFAQALSCYLHELAHMFGGEGSASFANALTEMLEIALASTRLVDFFHEKWVNS